MQVGVVAGDSLLVLSSALERVSVSALELAMTFRRKEALLN